jgi:hypothetical protein
VSDEKQFQGLIRKPETKEQRGKSVRKWEDCIKILYNCRGCVLNFVKICAYGKDRGTS